MNTLTLIRKQIQKAAAVHDAQITHTAYRVLSMISVVLRTKSLMGLLLSQSHLHQVIAMGALQVVGLTSLACVAFIGMIYGELLLLHRG